ncbi:hypothetical protein HJG60_008243 [Phyllostomus discolor]|uniref:Uncharacterized protein n=1 Tax=Phyllostomus discolor TaxID=89673 RepID=A0A833Z8T8_9CHIR|nr:hypothetical protein HJG60_008243 [Phyllostomus discolor]
MILESTLLELTQGAFRLTSQSTPLGEQKPSHTSAIWLCLYQSVVSLKSLRLPLCYRFLLAIFQESNLRSFPGKTAMNHTTNQSTRLFHGLTLASQVNPSSSGLSGDDQNPYMPPSGMTFQSKSWSTKPLFTTGLIGFMQRNLILSLIPSECQILEGSGREKTTKREGKSFSF